MIKLNKVLYTAVATAEGGRDGHTATDDGKLDVKLSPPAELGGPADGIGTNPEQLFAAGYSSCFHSAVKLVAQRLKLDPEGSTVTAKVGFGSIEGAPGFGLTVELVVSLPNIPDREQAQEVVERSHKVCPYSNAVRDNVEVTLTLV
jgi:osmotically inducible protein OsmC